MNAIKFRAYVHTMDDYDVRENKFPIYEMIYSDEPEFNDWFPTVNDLNESECEPMQFTGLLDKNSMEIYEGDIIKCDDMNEPNHVWHISEVKWDEDYLCWTLYRQCEDCNIDGSLFEVIGNIYENPELLKSIAHNG